MEPIFWLVLFAILVIVEIATMGLTTIWFAGGALVAFVVSMLGGPLWLEVVLFFAISIVLLWLTRPVVMKYVNKRHIKTNAESLEGQTGVVTEEIDNIQATGQVSVNGQEWTARAVRDDMQIKAGQKVTIKSISGVKLIVTEREE